MEKHRELARQLNYTETIDCGALRIHIFHEDFLALNTESTRPIDLASCTFSGNEMPSVTSSVIEILPNTPVQDFEFVGSVNFEVPSDCVRGEFTKDVLLRKLLIHLDQKIDYIGSHLEIEGSELIVNNPSQKPIHISLTVETYSDAYFEISAPLEISKPSSFTYNDIVFSSTIWGHIHDFLIHASPLDFHDYRDGGSNNIYIGQTNHGKVSDLEIAIETHISNLKSENPSATLPDWDPAINGHRLQKLGERILTYSMMEDIAADILSQKREEYGKDDVMSSITQEDVIASMNRLL